MNDTRLVQLMAALDDARTYADDLLEGLDSTNPAVLPLKRVMRHADADLDDLSRHDTTPMAW